LDRVKAMPPAFFEQLIVKLMLRLGYGGTADDAGQTLGKSGDGGVDGVINQDKLGLEKIYLQAKRWTDGTVGRPEIQRFIGALTGQHATKGVFITTSTFSQEAKEFARFVPNFKISLVDGVELARLMIEHNLGVALVERYEVKRVDSDFFSEG
jgi:restriction system protein